MTICHPDRVTFAKGLCNACYMEQYRAERKRRPIPWCHPDRPHKAHGMCRVCYNTSMRRQEDRRVKWRRYDLRKLYGITPEQYEQMLAEQDGVCKICHQPPKGRHRLSIDHDHKTGIVRGLLCGKCNVGIVGLENPVFVTKALAYLGRPDEKMDVGSNDDGLSSSSERPDGHPAQ